MKGDLASQGKKILLYRGKREMGREGKRGAGG